MHARTTFSLLLLLVSRTFFALRVQLLLKHARKARVRECVPVCVSKHTARLTLKYLNVIWKMRATDERRRTVLQVLGGKSATSARAVCEAF